MIRLHPIHIDIRERGAFARCGKVVGRVIEIDERSDCYREILRQRVENYIAHPPVKSTGGVGTEIRRLLKSQGISDDDKCGCIATAAEWDRRGVAWCEQHIDQITDYLVAQGKARGWVMGMVAKLAAKSIVREAIEAAKKSAAVDDREKTTTLLDGVLNETKQPNRLG